ncbi:DUF6386 family protein [Brevibacillus laterosporus]
MQGSFRFITNTATMCVYDLGELKHRLDDTQAGGRFRKTSLQK